MGYTYYSMTNTQYDWISQGNLIIWYFLLTLNFLLLRINYKRKSQNNRLGLFLFGASSLSATTLFIFPEMLFDIWNYVALVTLVFTTYTLWRITNLSNFSKRIKTAFFIAPGTLGLCLLLKWTPSNFGLIMLMPLLVTSAISILSLFNKSSKTM